MSELRTLAEHCHFGGMLNKMLRDRLVCGVNDKAIQRRLLLETDVTLENIEKVARTIEAAAQITHALNNASDLPCKSDCVHHTADRRPGVNKRSCYRCGSKDHTAPDCKFKQAKCHGCGKMGHLQSLS